VRSGYKAVPAERGQLSLSCLFELQEGWRKSRWCLTCKFAKSLGQSKSTCSSSSQLFRHSPVEKDRATCLFANAGWTLMLASAGPGLGRPSPRCCLFRVAACSLWLHVYDGKAWALLALIYEVCWSRLPLNVSFLNIYNVSFSCPTEFGGHEWCVTMHFWNVPWPCLRTA